MTTGNQPRLIAYYLPQYHPIPENDIWWGKGFTEWTNVARAKPLFKGHYQPHIPADLGFYDLRVPEVREAQAQMAKEAGLEGFCYWHYWFASKRLLERPFDEVLASGKPDFPFCLAWANASWTGAWYGAPDRILVEQNYPGMQDHTEHFYALLPAFRDNRYIRIDGKPLLTVFQPSDLHSEVLEHWNNLAVAAGLGGIFWLGIVKNADEGQKIQKNSFNACTISRTAGRGIFHDPLKKILIKLSGEKKAAKFFQKVFRKPFHVYDYDGIKPFFEFESIQGIDYFPCVMPNWDNTPRAGLDGLVFENSTPELFQSHLHQAIQKVEPLPEDHRVVIIKSWNEWAEGNHLEPEIKIGRGYLEAIRKELDAR